MGVGVESNHLGRGMNPATSLFHTTPSQHHRTSRTAVTWRHTPPAQGSTGMDAWETRRNVLSCNGYGPRFDRRTPSCSGEPAYITWPVEIL